MNITIIGYGKMGKEIEQAAIEKGHKIELILDIHNPDDFNSQMLSKTDIAIEFTSPHSAPDNIIRCLKAGLPVVTGSTGWNERFDEVTEICKEYNGSLFHASNFSPGVNILFAVNEYLAQIMNSFPQYNVEIIETHHTQKLDAPSGTAISLAEQIIKNINRKNEWALNNEENPHAINITALREGDIKGTHQIDYNSDIDYISLKHFAKSRKGFALGAIMAAEYLVNKKGIYNMRDLLGI